MSLPFLCFVTSYKFLHERRIQLHWISIFYHGIRGIRVQRQLILFFYLCNLFPLPFIYFVFSCSKLSYSPCRALCVRHSHHTSDDNSQQCWSAFITSDLISFASVVAELCSPACTSLVDPSHNYQWYYNLPLPRISTGDSRPLQHRTLIRAQTQFSWQWSFLTHWMTHTGNISLLLGSLSFKLNNVYHIPDMRKNLLLIAQFTRDNNVMLAFDASHLYILDPTTGAILLKGICRD